MGVLGGPRFLLMKILWIFLLPVIALSQTAQKPIIFDTDGMQRQVDGLSDYLDAKGYCFENVCTARIEKTGTQIGYVDEGDPFVSFDDIALQADAARWTLSLTHNGNLAGGEFLGYTELIAGDDTPVIIGRKSELISFTFSNNRATADYELQFRKNSTAAANFYTISVDNTQFFSQDLPSPEPFNAGDQIYIQYIDQGQNARDSGLILLFKAVL